MRRSRRPYPLVANDEPAVVFTDDGGSGLLDACKDRFTPPEFEVECDAAHTVWVKRKDGSRSFGVSPWQASRLPMEKVLERVQKKLELPSGNPGASKR